MPHDPTDSAVTTSLAPPIRRRDTWAAIGMVSILVAVMCGIAHGHLTGTSSAPGGLYVVTTGYAVATLWLISRLFSRRPA
jgi:hypothetical protein